MTQEASKNGSVAKKIFLGVIIAIVSAALSGYSTYLWSQNTVSRHAAQTFLREYYDQVTNPHTTQEAWKTKLATDWKNGDNESAFVSWWSNWSKVVITSDVEDYPNIRDGYAAQIAYVDRNGIRHSARRLTYRFDCTNPWAGRIPHITCDPKDVRLTDTYRPSQRG